MMGRQSRQCIVLNDNFGMVVQNQQVKLKVNEKKQGLPSVRTPQNDIATHSRKANSQQFKQQVIQSPKLQLRAPQQSAEQIYLQAASEYQDKLHLLSKLLNKIEYDENLRSVSELQEYFQFCKDNISLGIEQVALETDLAKRKRDNERLQVEVSALKSHLERSQQMIRQYQSENYELKKQLFQGQEDTTALYKQSVVQETKARNLVRKTENLQRGLLTLSSQGLGDLDRQSRLKTTIHTLVLENNSLKKELSMMKNLNSEQQADISRLKKKINHVVMKLGEEMKQTQMVKEKRKTSPIKRLELSEKGRGEEEASDLCHTTGKLPSFDEFEKMEYTIEGLHSIANASREAHTENRTNDDEKDNEFLGIDRIQKSNFNLQGPYWKDRTNAILKQHQRAGQHVALYTPNGLINVPSLFAPDSPIQRLNLVNGNSDFRLNFLSPREQSLMKEFRNMGVENFVEVTMSRKEQDLQRTVAFLARELSVNQREQEFSSFLLGEMFHYYFKGQGTAHMLFRLNRYSAKFLQVNDVKVWVRDILNNFLWTQSGKNQYELGPPIDAFKECLVSQRATVLPGEVLAFPIYSCVERLVLGFVAIVPQEDLLEEKSLEERLSYEVQVSATSLAEFVSMILTQNHQRRDADFYIMKREKIQKHSLSILKASSEVQYFKALEDCLKDTLEVEKLKLAIVDHRDPGDPHFWTVFEKNQDLFSTERLDLHSPSLFKFAFEKRKPYLVQRSASHKWFNPLQDLHTQRPLNCLPLIDAKGEVLAVLQHENLKALSRGEEATASTIVDNGLMKVLSDIAEIASFHNQR